jgi:hypothetical protein
MKWTLLGCFFLLSLSTYAHAQAVDQQSELDEEMQVLVKNYVTQHPEVSIDDAITRLTIQAEILYAMEKPPTSVRWQIDGDLHPASARSTHPG